MSQKINGGDREWASQVPDLHFKICHLGPKSAFSLPKSTLEPTENGQMKGNSGSLHMQLDFPVPKGPLGPSNSTICVLATHLPHLPPFAPKIASRKHPLTSYI